MIDCIEQTGRALNLNNEGIVKYLCGIEEERKNLEIIIQKQYQERKRVEAEIERLTYKLCLINKSLSMRIKAKNNYDKTIEEIRGHYERLVDSSNKLRQIVEKTQQELDDIMNKKTGTGPEGGAITMLYVKPDGDLCEESCPCSYTPEIPTKEKSAVPALSSSKPTDLRKESTTPPNSTGDFEEKPQAAEKPQAVEKPQDVEKPSADEVLGGDDTSQVTDMGSTKVLSEGPTSSIRNKTGLASEGSAARIISKKLSIEDQKTKNSPKGSNTNWLEEDSSKNLLLSRLKATERTTKSRQLPAKSGEDNSSLAEGLRSAEEESTNKSEASQII